MRRSFLLSLVLCAAAILPVHAADVPVQPDFMKYEFARSYISALSYMKDIDDRWNKNAPKKLFANQKQKMILATINDLSLDSTDLLIIKNYLLKYMTAPNVLMRKIADIVVVSTSKQIAINHEEKVLWQKWYELNAAGQATRSKEEDFVKTQYGLELKRKEADKEIIQASAYLTKLLVAQNKNGNSRRLAITAQQRQKLLDKLDSFGGDDLDWGLKSGQRTLQASVAVIRELLEDSIWVAVDEK